jgi:hypothetical protein
LLVRWKAGVGRDDVCGEASWTTTVAGQMCPEGCEEEEAEAGAVRRDAHPWRWEDHKLIKDLRGVFIKLRREHARMVGR